MTPSMEMLGGDMGGGKNIVAIGSSALFVVGSAFKAFAKVSEGELGVRTNMGRATRTKGRRAGELYGIVQPGYHLVIPFTHNIIKVSIQDRNKDLDKIQVNCDEGRQMTIDSSITWAVRSDDDHPYRALFAVESGGVLSEHVANVCTAGLRTVLDGANERSMKDHRTVSNDLKDLCQDDLLVYGTELKRLNIKTVTRTFGQMIMESNASTNTALLGVIPDPRDGMPPPLHVAN